jgi:hypothetical protein
MYDKMLLRKIMYAPGYKMKPHSDIHSPYVKTILFHKILFFSPQIYN